MKDVRSGIARIFNAYGENMDLGEYSHVVPALIGKAIFYPEKEFTVWGDGTQSRDFLYVSDCVEALVKLESKVSSPPLTVNIGSAETVPISTLAQKIVGLSGKSMTPVYDTEKPVGPLSRTAHTTKARALLDWQPQISLEEGLKRTYAWVEKRMRG